MIDARDRDVGAAFGLGENERALQHRLCVQREALRRPVASDAALLHRLGDIGFDLFGMAADAGVAGVANGGMGVVDLLHHRADEAGEIRHVALEQRAAEIDVAEHAIERILVRVIGRGREEGAGHLRPVIRRRNGERFLAVEMMEERALRHAGARAQLIDRGRDVALLADHGEGRIQQLLPGRGHAGFGRHIAHRYYTD